MTAVRKPMPDAAAAESVADLNAEGMEAIVAFWGALVEGKPAGIEEVLAPEFQIMREDGSADDKRDYLASGYPHVAAVPDVSRLVVTAHGDTMVTRYTVKVHETRDGMRVERNAPRLTVFRRDAGRWLTVAHGNFATVSG
jgi:hypothetical protein